MFPYISNQVLHKPMTKSLANYAIKNNICKCRGLFRRYSMACRSFASSSFSYTNEEYARKDEYACEENDPTQCSEPSNAIDVQEEIGEPLVASDKVTGVDEGDI